MKTIDVLSLKLELLQNFSKESLKTPKIGVNLMGMWGKRLGFKAFGCLCFTTTP
jgi:hypothetical protein